VQNLTSDEPRRNAGACSRSRHLTLEQALRIARAAVGGPVHVRDIGLLEWAINRPRSSILGQDAYPDVLTKAAALLHSLARNRSLVDGNKRLAWLATYVFCAKNAVELDADDDAANELVIGVACGRIDDVDDVAAALAGFVA
jgi:death on curing protein